MLLTLELLIIASFIAGGWSQVIFPLLKGKSLFPLFKKNHSMELERELTKAREKKKELELQLELHREESELLEKQIELQQVQYRNIDLRLESLNSGTKKGEAALKAQDEPQPKQIVRPEGLKQ